jgi:asparagine synthase (glutamine-hydrolysing)
VCTFKITNYKKHLEIDAFLSLGGPDSSTTLEVNNILFTHNLLSITGIPTQQPVEHNNKLYLLLGEIYNYNKSYPSDVYSVIELYEIYGNNFTSYLDGEFLVIVYDSLSNQINFFTDPWSTRLCWYTITNDFFCFSSFPLNNMSDRLLGNGHYIFDVTSNRFISINTIHIWDLKQYKNNFEDWNIAFEKAVLKRYHKDTTVALSGGLDSSAIALCLSDNSLPFTSINLLINNSEDADTLKTVISYIKNYNTFYYINKSLALDLLKKSHKSISSIFLYDKILGKHPLNILAYFMSTTLNKRVLFTGQGADEIIDNYIGKSNKYYMKSWPLDLTTVFPYDNFYGNSQRKFIDEHEYCCLANGIESRNPFLDKELTQEWLWISADIKNSESKSPLKNYFRNRGIPLPKNTIGLGHQVLK